MEITVESMRLPPGMVGKLKPNKRPPRHRQGKKFLRGPIPWDWIQHAMRLSPQCWIVGTHLWFQAGCKRTRTVLFCQTWGEPLGISFYTMRRAIRRMERAGLISIERRPGHGLTVTILYP